VVDFFKVRAKKIASHLREEHQALILLQVIDAKKFSSHLDIFLADAIFKLEGKRWASAQYFWAS
jgi:hypothetical protein